MHLLPDQKIINSVGIDVGTSTSHLIFSELVLKKDPKSKTEKYHVAERHIKYRGNIFFTPLTNNEIDIEELSQCLKKEYIKAGINASEVDTGAVIITGESAKRENAERIVELLSKETGKFVAASAGPNFEAIISAYGSGAVKLSESNSSKIIHTDVGGGTANVAVIDSGEITATACINVGGRLIVFNDREEIVRIEPPGKLTIEHCKLDLSIGDVINSNQKEILAQELAKALFELLSGQELSKFARELMMTPNLPPESFDDNPKLSFSGGIAEYVYLQSTQDFNDLGLLLGSQIRMLTENSESHRIEVPEKIRATVIGASEYTLQVSGSTTFISPNFSESGLPIRSLPIVMPKINRNNLSEDYVAKQITSALKRLDIIEGSTPIALAFDDPVRTVYDKLTVFSKGIVKALPQTISNNKPLILVFNTDIGNSVGNVLYRETQISNEILSIDEILLREGDFIDIGKPVVENIVFPVVVKSLIFN